MDKIGYTLTTTDYPLTWHIDKELDVVDFFTIGDLKLDFPSPELLGNDRNYKIKKPVKAFHRTTESAKANLLDGTFYQFEDTHFIDVEVFNKIIQEPKLGVGGFYLYGYLKHKCDLFKKFQASRGRLERETRISKRSLDRYLHHLESMNLITVWHAPFVYGAPEEDHEANTYQIPK